MTLSEKLYALRKKSGLSQEQLAEQLHVSRQAISKWESGASVPESEKLIAISNYFNVSLDYLIKEEYTQSENDSPQSVQKDAAYAADHSKNTVGFIFCIGGIICLIVWGLLSMFNPEASRQLRESSLITIDGNGIFLILCAASIVFGAALILKDRSKK